MKLNLSFSQLMENFYKKHVVLKFLLALLPAAVFTQNYGWMTANSYIGWAFLLIWALMIWSVAQFTEKNQVLERLFRQTEIGFFLLPVSAIVLTFVLGAQSVSSTTSSAGQAGAAIGTAIGGTFAVILSFIFGLTGGVIMHLVAGKYDKKAKFVGTKETETLAAKHGVILSVVGVIVLAVIMGLAASAHKATMQAEEKAGLQQAGASQSGKASSETGTDKVSIEITKKGFIEADYRAGTYEDLLTMTFRITNHTAKDIKGVQGVVTFYDIFGNKIFASNLAYDQGILASSTKTYETSVHYNQFMEDEVKLRNTSLDNLKFKWDVSTIVYADDTTETF